MKSRGDSGTSLGRLVQGMPCRNPSAPRDKHVRTVVDSHDSGRSEAISLDPSSTKINGSNWKKFSIEVLAKAGWHAKLLVLS